MQYLLQYYGLDGLEGNADLLADLSRYGGTLRNPPDSMPGMVDPICLGRILSGPTDASRQMGGGRLGMKPTLLTAVFDRRTDLPIPIRRNYIEYGCLVEEGLSEDLILRFATVTFQDFF